MFILRLESCQKYFQENCAFRDRVNPISKESTFDSIGTNSGVTNDVNFICVFFAHLSLPWSIVLVALSFLGCCRRRPTMVTPDQISTLINIYRPYTNPVSPNTKQYQAILTQYRILPTSTAPY